MRSLLPDVPDNALFEAIFIDLLPANARDAAVRHEVLEDMAEAADKVLAEAPASSPMSVSEVATEADDPAVARVFRPPSSTKKPKDPTLCFVHARYGHEAWKCSSPKTCRIKDNISKPNSSPALGNAKAGRP